MQNRKRISCNMCGRKMKRIVGPRLVLGKYVVENVAYDVCGHCGQELIPLEEYEKIRKKITSAEKGARKVPIPGRALGAARYFII